MIHAHTHTYIYISKDTNLTLIPWKQNCALVQTSWEIPTPQLIAIETTHETTQGHAVPGGLWAAAPPSFSTTCYIPPHPTRTPPHSTPPQRAVHVSSRGITTSS